MAFGKKCNQNAFRSNQYQRENGALNMVNFLYDWTLSYNNHVHKLDALRLNLDVFMFIHSDLLKDKD